MIKQVKAGIYIVAFLITSLIISPQESFARDRGNTFMAKMQVSYTVDDLVQLLRKNGYVAKKLGTSNSIILVTVDGDDLSLLIADSRNKIVFRDAFGSEYQASLSKANELNASHDLIKVHLESDGILVMDYAIGSPTAGISEKQILEALEIFIFARKQIADFLIMRIN